MRKYFSKIIALATLLTVSLQLCAQNESSDSIFLYKTWTQMFDLTPEAVVIEPLVQVNNPYEVEILTMDPEVNEAIINNFVAATLSDSIWLVSSQYLKRNFKGDAKNLYGFVPLVYNEKVAFAVYGLTSLWDMSVVDFLFGESESSGASDGKKDYYYIDFLNRKVLRVTPKVLSGLLEDYHDLQMRYEGMKDYKKSEIIEEYFLKFIERASNDIMRPYILDLVKE